MLKTFLADRQGNLTALAAVFLVGTTFMVGFAFDLANYERQNQRLQNAVDAASLAFGAAMREFSLEDRASFTCPLGPALEALAANGYGPDQATATAERLDIDNKPACRLTVTGRADTLLSESFGLVDADIQASATVVFEGQAPICVMAMADAGHATFDLRDSGAIDAKACAAYVGSDDRASIDWGGGDYDIKSICTVGPTDVLDPRVRPFCPEQPDPLAHLAYTGSTACDYVRSAVKDNWKVELDGSVHVSPGVYCGGLDLTDVRTPIRFKTGVYVIKDGPLSLNVEQSVVGEGVTFVLTGSNAVLDVTGVERFLIEAPKSGPLKGVVVMQHGAENNNLRSDIRGQAIDGFEGAVYLPRQRLHLTGILEEVNATPANYVFYLARRVRIDGDQPVHIPFQPGKSKVPMPASPYTAGIPRLVK